MAKYLAILILACCLWVSFGTITESNGRDQSIKQKHEMLDKISQEMEMITDIFKVSPPTDAQVTRLKELWKIKDSLVKELKTLDRNTETNTIKAEPPTPVVEHKDVVEVIPTHANVNDATNFGVAVETEEQIEEVEKDNEVRRNAIKDVRDLYC
jgi:hypothetical protein